MADSRPIPHQDITYQIIGAGMRVHNRLGPGHKESVYQRDLTAEMRVDGLKVREEYPVAIYREDGTFLGYLFIDHVVEDLVIVEAKAVSHLLTQEEIAQVITYLAATGLKVGLLLNFGRRKLEFRRILPPTKLEGWENRLIRYLWQPDDPVAAANAFAARGIEPGQIVVPSSDVIYPARSPSVLLPSDPIVKPPSAESPQSSPGVPNHQGASADSSAPQTSANPFRRRQSADHPSANPLPQGQSADSNILTELFAVIRDRKANPPPEGSYTARLFAAGTTEIAKKVGEEAIEVIVASAEGDTDQLVYEAADLVYHLLVLLAQHDVDIEALYAELKRRRK